MRVAGVNIKSGGLHIAILDSPTDGCELGTPVPGSHAPPLRLNAALGEVAGINDLMQRVRQHLAPHRLDRVGLVETRKFSQWAYLQAHERVTTISALLFALIELSIDDFATVKTDKIAKTIDVPPHMLDRTNFADFGFEERPRYWTTGYAEAYALAAHLHAKASA